MAAALLVFAKVPRPGKVKTRLTPVLTPGEAARLYEAFLRDALRLYVRLTVDVHLYIAPPVTEGLEGLPEQVTVHRQEGPDLGTRMKQAFRETFDIGYERAAVIGTDHPTLPLMFVRQAFSALDAPRSTCIGPSEDGGFYLLGMNDFYPQLFEGMSYSHDNVFSDTLTRVATTDSRLTVLPRWYDVDTPEALTTMVSDLEDEDIEAPHTRSAVKALALHTLSASE